MGSEQAWRPRAGSAVKPEYQAIFEADTEGPSDGDEAITACSLPAGRMPWTMLAYEPLEIIVTPRRDVCPRLSSMTSAASTPTGAVGRRIDPSFNGYSIGEWRDEDGDGRYDTLLVENRGFRGPRLRCHRHSALRRHEPSSRSASSSTRITHDLLRDEVTTVDDALTRPWTVMRTYNREHDPLWPDFVCAEDNHHVVIRGESYFTNAADGNLMPTREDQPPPDPRYFDRTTIEHDPKWTPVLGKDHASAISRPNRHSMERHLGRARGRPDHATVVHHDDLVRAPASGPGRPGNAGNAPASRPQDPSRSRAPDPSPARC